LILVCRVVLTVDWDKCDVGDVKVETEGDLLSYLTAQIESNALFDHLPLKIMDAVYLNLHTDHTPFL